MNTAALAFTMTDPGGIKDLFFFLRGGGDGEEERCS